MLALSCRGDRFIFPSRGRNADAELVCRALNNALETRHIEGRLIFHSDQGSQYSSKKFHRLLWRNKVIQSMSRRGNCDDNSLISG
ncbi:DDE-type integrase/transposase/recombinase [Xenorhabdus bovienii]|uniref:DDE-type integrase/transposase/recombinase n=1 Tax=Xenorhabdus bovienii TaxID=40576 RepID=UPI000306DF0D